MSTKSVLSFIDTVIQHFPPFRWDDEQEKTWVNTMVRELGGYADAVLDRAVQEMVRTRKDRKIPLVSECLAACHEAKRWVDAEKNAGSLKMGGGASDGRDPIYSDYRQRLAEELIMCPIGRQAALEGWILRLRDYARQHGKLPPAGEIGVMKREAKALDDALDIARRGETDSGRPWPQAKEWVSFGAAMLNERQRLVDLVLHGVVR